MFDITLIAMGKLKEKFYISAAEEYKKRLGGYCRFTLLELPEVRLPENPSPAEISAGLEKEAELIFSKIPKGAWFCIFTPEGKLLSSEALAEKMWKEILNPKYKTAVPEKSKVGIILYKTGRLLHNHKLISSVFDRSLVRRLWGSIVFHIRNPKTIFGRKEK